TIVKIEETIKTQEGVMAIDDIRTRLFGNKIYVDIEIAADGQQSLTQAHGIAQGVHDMVEKNFPEVKHCMVHVNPCRPSVAD
ncbi:MAG: cation transporter dimerization domain-containing protein, partial [Oscillospiraceae bacterium]